MSESAKKRPNLRPKTLRDDQTSVSQADIPVGNPPPHPTPVAIPQQSKLSQDNDGQQSEHAYIASLRRSIKQMTNGDVQPVREGLEELRRGLEADAEDNSLDK
ncbi:MAG: hypothetical protein OXG78_09480 [Chloroflexi bacterium]|nr:hypothetical protein [Chloroflexota bacterium]